MGSGEGCHDGNVADGEGCQVSCQLEICGNGILQVGNGEECDDGNVADGDGCDAICQVESCGNDILQVGNGEECDDGNSQPLDGCEPTCLFLAPDLIPATAPFGRLILAACLVLAGSVWMRRRARR